MIVLLNKYIKFELGLKKQIGANKGYIYILNLNRCRTHCANTVVRIRARYIKFNTASIETGFGFKSSKRLSGGIYEI